MGEDDGYKEACQLKIVQMKGHDRKERFKDDVDVDVVMRYSRLEASGDAAHS